MSRTESAVVSNVKNAFVGIPSVDGYVPISARFEGSWTGLPLMGNPMRNNGSWGVRFASSNSENFSLNGVVYVTYIPV